MAGIVDGDDVKEIVKKIDNLSGVLEKLIKSIDNFNTSTSDFAKSQKTLQILLCIFTFLLVVVGAIQGCFAYKTLL